MRDTICVRGRLFWFKRDEMRFTTRISSWTDAISYVHKPYIHGVLYGRIKSFADDTTTGYFSKSVDDVDSKSDFQIIGLKLTQ